jgi:urease subunit beta
VRFEPCDEREVTLVPFGGKHQVHGFNNLVDGWAPVDGSYRPRATRAIRLAAERGFRSAGPPERPERPQWPERARSAKGSAGR